MNESLFYYFILFVSLVNLLRMAMYLIGSDLYSIKNTQNAAVDKSHSIPFVTVFIPAHNEERTILRTLMSVYESDYPYQKLEAIVINDGSTDKTKKIVQSFQQKYCNRFRIKLINLSNHGKAGALNYAMKTTRNGSLFMCLDADSSLEKNALRNAVKYFRNKNVVALSSNVNIIEDGSLMSLVQRFEYLVCYQMKKAQAQTGVEYIIGGIGSMFRRTILERVSYYDTNTMTEDIDLTMKILVNKEKREQITYAADSIVYTESAHTIPELMSQRFRWKHGRAQTFLKNRSLFFSQNPKHSKRLSWFMLPFSLMQDLLFFAEPLIIGWFIYILFVYDDARTIASAAIVITVFLLLNIWSTIHLSVRDRVRLSLWSPLMYVLMFILTFAEYYALIKSTLLLPGLRKSIQTKHVAWKSPERRTISP